VLSSPVSFRTAADPRRFLGWSENLTGEGWIMKVSPALSISKELEVRNDGLVMSWLITLVYRVSSCWVPSTRLTIPRVSLISHSLDGHQPG
jgi:hypothetical protein